VAWIYEQIKAQKKNHAGEIDMKKITQDYLLFNLADDIASSEGTGCDNMTVILILLKKNL